MNQSVATMGAPAPSAWRLRIALLFFVLRRVAPPARVSRTRYGVGIVLFAIAVDLP